MKTKHGKTRIPRNYLRPKGKGNMKTAMIKYFAEILAESVLDIQVMLINQWQAICSWWMENAIVLIPMHATRHPNRHFFHMHPSKKATTRI